MNAIILCGGLSTRLGDIARQVPKVLLPIKGRTVLEWQLKKLQRLGVDTVVLAAGHLADVLGREVGDEYAGVKIRYAVEPERLGTGGAIKYAWQFVDHPHVPTIVCNGDVLTSTDIAHLLGHLRPDSQGIILGSRVEDSAPYGTLEYDQRGRLRAFREKEGKRQPGYINAGVYLLTSRAQELFPDRAHFSIEYDVFPFLEDLDVYASDEPWIDIGVPERLAWAQEHWPEEAEKLS